MSIAMSNDATDLKGQVAVVTGAGRGIGKAIAIGFARAGARICCAARSQDQILNTVTEARNLGAQAIAQVTDVTNLDSVSSLFSAAETAFGGVDIVVVNAGISSNPRKTVEAGDPEAWRHTIEVNLMGAYYTAKAAIPHLRRRGGGKIILLGSGLGHRGLPERSAYACSKAGVWMLTRVLALELQSSDISVNELIPGPVATTVTPENAQQLSGVGGSEWLKQPEDVVPLALFLASQPKTGPTAQSFSLMRRDG
jgi:3-oxoacyl-[acyl-carrier protein] reductase